MKLTVSANTDVGLKREKNEDAFLVNSDADIYIVADGMGGHRGGDLASRLAVESVQDVVLNHKKNTTYFSPRAMLEEGFIEASRRIYEESQTDPNYLQGMGTTLVTVYFHEDTLYIGNVGDSRAYFFNDQYMWQITEDHSLLNEHIKAGLIKDSEAKDFAAKNVITRSVGFEKDVRCDIFQRKIKPGEKFLICSDGLCGLVEDERIFEICQKNSPEVAVDLCIEEAKQNGGDDNITVMVIHVES